MNTEELINNLKLNRYGEVTEVEGKTIIDLQTSNNFGDVTAKLDNSNLFEIAGNRQEMSVEQTILYYENEDLQIKLSAEWENNKYQIEITEMR